MVSPAWSRRLGVCYGGESCMEPVQMVDSLRSNIAPKTQTLPDAGGYRYSSFQIALLITPRTRIPQVMITRCEL